VLKTGTPYQDMGADFYIRRESPEQRHAYLERQLQRLHIAAKAQSVVTPHRTESRSWRPPARIVLHGRKPGC
jgi:hypothetical protein